MSNLDDFKTNYFPTWCPGCGDFGIWAGLKNAFVQCDLSPEQMMIVFGVGCSGNMNDFLHSYSLHSLHGRALPNAVGIRIANHKLPLVCIVGDGDCYGEGGNHFIHACRANWNMTVVVHDNRVYGLTTGQVAPTAHAGFKSKSTPFGIIEQEINPLAIAIISGATFVAQAFAQDIAHVAQMIVEGIKHQGFSLVNVLQPCVTFNHENTYQYYREHTYKLEPTHDPSNKEMALKKALESSGEKIPLGVFYKTARPTYEESLPQLAEKSLVEQLDTIGKRDISGLIAEFR